MRPNDPHSLPHPSLVPPQPRKVSHRGSGDPVFLMQTALQAPRHCCGLPWPVPTRCRESHVLSWKGGETGDGSIRRPAPGVRKSPHGPLGHTRFRAKGGIGSVGTMELRWPSQGGEVAQGNTLFLLFVSSRRFVQGGSRASPGVGQGPLQRRETLDKQGPGVAGARSSGRFPPVLWVSSVTRPEACKQRRCFASLSASSCHHRIP